MNESNRNEAAAEGHIFHRFDKELQHLIKLVSEMGTLATQQIRDAGKAVKKCDVERARQVMDREDRMDELDIEIEREIHRVLALRSPVARDLRILLTVNRMGSYLERIGDQARRVAKLCVELHSNSDRELNQRLFNGIPRMAKYVNAMVDMSIRAFENQDMELALEVVEMERDLSEQFDSAMRSLTTYVLEDPRFVGEAMKVVLGLRSLDRIGGHAKSICRQIIFMVKGVNVRHESLENLTAEVRSSRTSRP